MRNFLSRSNGKPEKGKEPPYKETATQPVYHVDILSTFLDTVYVAGWVFHLKSTLLSIHVVCEEKQLFAVDSIGLPSEDIMSSLGSQAKNCRFWGSWTGKMRPGDIANCALVFRFSDGTEFVAARPALESLQNDPVFQLVTRFQLELQVLASGSLLEIGSRARSGITRREMMPVGWSYTGLDILAGENVDVVCDAHDLASILPRESFNAFMSFSVFEHLLMPWKVALELNYVLRNGALGLISTHQSWPIHEQPWDFWRFCSESWKAIFNRVTGFEIIDTCMGEPAFLVSAHCHPAVDFGRSPTAFLSSAVLVRKIGPTALTWPVRTEEITETMYPPNVST